MSDTTNQDTGVGPMSLDDAAALMDSRDEEESHDEEAEEVEQDDEAEEAETEGDTEEAEEGDEEVEAQFEEFEQDGKKYAVPKELKDSLLRHADYTKKTQEIADQRRIIETHAKNITEERNFYANQLKGFVESLQATAQQLPTDAQLVEMSKTDPLGYIQAKAARDELMVKQYQAQQAQEYMTKQQQAQDDVSYQEMLKHEHNSLMTKLPEWKNEKVAAKERTELASYLTSEGYDNDDISGLTDSRAVIIARKAMLYDKMIKGGAKQAAPKTGDKHVIKVLSPGKQQSGQPKQSKELTQRFKQSNSIDDALALLNSRTRG